MAGEIKFIKFRVPIIIEADENIMHVYSPAFKSLHLEGKSLKEALQSGRDAARFSLESLIRSGEPIPLDIVGYNQALGGLDDSQTEYVEEIRIDL